MPPALAVWEETAVPRRLAVPALVCVLSGLMLAGGRAGAQEPPLAPVTVAPVETVHGSVRLSLPATLTAARVAALSVEAAGLVSELLVDEGDAVVADTALLRLRPQRKTLARDALRAEHERARAAEQLAAVKEKRLRRLVEQRMTPQDSYDVARAELAQARAATRAAAAQLALAEDEVARLELRAPFAGVISRKHTEPGAWVSPGDVVLELTETAALRAEFALPQQHYPQLAPGSAVQLNLDAYPDTALKLTVTRMIPVVRESGRTLLVRASLPNHDGRYAPGMSGTIDVALGAPGAGAGPAVPVDAVLVQPDGARIVWRVDRDGAGAGAGGIAVPVPIRVGRRMGAHIEVLEVLIPDGLPPGSEVVVRGNERLRPGQAVTFTDSP